jgi:hypothetical protein
VAVANAELRTNSRRDVLAGEVMNSFSR